MSKLQKSKRDRGREHVGLEPKQVQHMSWYDEKGWHVFGGDDVEEGERLLSESLARFDNNINPDSYRRGNTEV